MKNYEVSLSEAFFNLKKHFSLYFVIAFVLTISIAFFASSFNLIISITSTPLDYKTPANLYSVKITKAVSENNPSMFQFSNAAVRSFLIENKALDSGLVVLKNTPIKLNNTADVQTEQRVDYTDKNFFKLLGVQPLVGSWPSSLKKEVAVSHKFWTKQLKQKKLENLFIIINQQLYKISAVMPKGFRTPNALSMENDFGKKSQVWVPVDTDEELLADTASYITLILIRDSREKGPLTKEISSSIYNIKQNIGALEAIAIELEDLKSAVYGDYLKKAYWLLIAAVVFLCLCLVTVLFLLSSLSQRKLKELSLKKILGADNLSAIGSQIWEMGLVLLFACIVSIPLIYATNGLMLKLNLFSPELFEQSKLLRLLAVVLTPFILLMSLFVFIPLIKLSKGNLLMLLKFGYTANAKGQWFRQKSLLFIQSIVAFLICMLAILLVQENLKNMAHLSNQNLTNKSSLVVQIDDQVKSFSDIERIRERIISHPSVTDSVISTTVPIDLIGKIIKIANPVQNPDNYVEQQGVIVVKDKSEYEQSGRLSYAISINEVEKKYFDFFGIKFQRGGTFSDQNAVVLPFSLVSKIFDGQQDVINKIVPASISNDDWKVGIRASGIVGDTQIIGQGQNAQKIISQFTPVFRLLQPSINMQEYKSMVISFSHPGLEKFSSIKLDEWLKADLAHVKSMPLINLEKEAKKRVTQGSFAAILGIVLAVVAIVLVVAGTWSLVDSICRQSSLEIGIRVAIGASDSSIYFMMARKVLIPIMIALLLTTLAISFLSGTLLSFISVKEVVISFLILASLSVLFTWIPITATLRKKPAKILSQASV